MPTFGRPAPRHLNEKAPTCGAFVEPSDGLEPSTPSLPWRFSGVTRDHARSSETQFYLQINNFGWQAVGREASRVSFLMCPFCVRVLSPGKATPAKADGGCISLCYSTLRRWLGRDSRGCLRAAARWSRSSASRWEASAASLSAASAARASHARIACTSLDRDAVSVLYPGQASRDRASTDRPRRPSSG